MTRMSRELSLVLLGAGALTAGYFAWPEKDFEKQAEEQAQKRVGGNGTRMHGGFIFIGYLGGGRGSAVASRSPAMSGVSKGGFGTVGSRVGGGFGG